ncbi:hypothetical protein FM104_15480 [Microbacterium esteraromaticum]|uniref:Secreted protein n=1 Tax=Microbacterium esteraromaticum TaxID=57043 RepID=A0A1R4KS80_9MICO|nr:DUF6049 family protein [Microbacterium esteraromaticum]SJN46914.1 hypothetical protein FM104_15480 [Microbacterium esteraromaticum]
MTAFSPRDGSRPRALRLLSRLAAVLIVGSVAIGGASPASAEDTTDPAEADAVVTMSLSTGMGAAVAPDGPLVSTVTLANSTEAQLSAGTVEVELNRTALPDGTALDKWFDAGTAAGAFEPLASEPTPLVSDGDSADISVMVDATDLGDLKPGVYPVSAQLTGAKTTDADGAAIDWNLTASTVIVVTKADQQTVGVLVPITATPENGSLLTVDELATLTAPDGALSGQLDAVLGTTAILGVDPSIPTAIRMLGTRAPQSAIDWLDRLERLSNSFFMLQFADADPATQVHAGQKTLLGPPDLTPLLLDEDFPAATPSPAPTPTTTTTTTEDPEPTLPDSSDLGAIFGAQTDILWPRDDVNDADLDAFNAQDPVFTILPSTSVDGVSSARSKAGEHDLLVTDAAASARLSAAAELTDPAAIDRELAAAAGQLFYAAQGSDTVLVGLDRSETRSPVALRELLSTFASPTVNLAALRGSRAASATVSAEPDLSRATSLTAMLADGKRLVAFSSVLEEPAVLLVPERIRIMRTIGVGVEDESFSAAVAAQATSVQTTLDSVSIVQPKPVQLFTAAAPLPVWVRNDLPWPVNVSLNSSPSSPRLDIQPVTEVAALAATSTRVDVPIEARVASGDVQVGFRLYSPTGVPIGSPEVADVTLRAEWEGIGLGILGGLIGLLLVFGIVRTVLRKRRAQTDAVGADAADAGPASATDAASASTPANQPAPAKETDE